MPQDLTNIYLVGFMGTGKTTVGRITARKLDYQFIDVDKAIETQEGKTVTEIFTQHGAEHFRALEKKYILSGHPNQKCVVSCGGGLVIQPGMVETLKNRGIVICLTATPETIFERTSRTSKRPMLDVADPLTTIKQLLAERAPIYKSIGNSISTEQRPLKDVASQVIRYYHQHNQ